MEKGIARISKIWHEEYSSQIEKYQAFEVSEQFKRMAALFSPGVSYFYVLNLFNIQLDYVSASVEDFVGISREKVTINHLLNTVIDEEITDIENKEKVIKDFFNRFLEKGKGLSYKLVYSYQMKDYKGKNRTMLHQATPLSVSNNGALQHVLSIHTDISHLSLKSTKNVSFINLEGNTSYFNVNSEKGVFDELAASNRPSNIFEALTEREKQIVELLAKGHSTKQISDLLNVSEHTIRTHRRNILKKSNLKNTAELVAESMMAGLIS